MHFYTLENSNLLFWECKSCLATKKRDLINFKFQSSGYIHEIFCISKPGCWIPQQIHNLTALPYWLTHNIDRHTKVMVTFSASHQTLVKGHCLFSPTNAQGPQQSSFQQLCVSKCVYVCACLWGKTEAGDSLKRWRAVAVFHRLPSESNALYSLRSTLDNKVCINGKGQDFPLTAATSTS